jgi:uncharacterized membrane protein YhaH (DUF805 family)
MQLMFAPLRRFADFGGRSRRSEFWLFFLFQILVFIGWLVLVVALAVSLPELDDPAALFDGASGAVVVFLLLWLLWVLIATIPNAALVVRRFHDQNISGWVGGILYALTWLFNVTGLWIFNVPGIVLLIFMMVPGQRGANRFGPDPKQENTADIFA